PSDDDGIPCERKGATCIVLPVAGTCYYGRVVVIACSVSGISGSSYLVIVRIFASVARARPGKILVSEFIRVIKMHGVHQVGLRYLGIVVVGIVVTVVAVQRK